jgi:hypothetical protein
MIFVIVAQYVFLRSSSSLFSFSGG